MKIEDGKGGWKGYEEILKEVEDEGVFIGISEGRMSVVGRKDLEKLWFREWEYEVGFNEMEYK